MEATVKIEKRVPVPPTGRTTGMSQALKKMAIGDSFMLPPSITYPYSPHSYAKAAGVKVTIKKQKDGYRVWRIK